MQLGEHDDVELTPQERIAFWAIAHNVMEMG